jgi:transposase-like protein
MAKGQGKVAQNKSAIVARLPQACHDETAAVEFLEDQRWTGTGPCCPRCGDTDVYKMTDRTTGQRNKRFLWLCNGCKRQYTVRVGTVFEDSRIPLRHWCYGFWAASASKKGVSSKQIQRMTGLSYKSALFMMHRIRFAMGEDFAPSAKLTGVIEADATFVGGKEKNKHFHEREGRNMSGGKGKIPVFSMVERGGRVRSMVMEHVTAANLRRAILDNVDGGARLMTDSQSQNKSLRRPVSRHDMVDHSQEEYARIGTDGMLVSTNTVESVFSLLKRGVYGTFHSVSDKHLHRYLSEFDFRYNARRMDDGERTALAIRSADGKRLTYADQIANKGHAKNT